MADVHPLTGYEDRFSRQIAAGWDQARLASARVLVVGAGAIGNEVVKNLVLIGVRDITLVDFDRIAPSNLARCIFFSERDVGRPKAEVVAEAARRLAPDARILAFHGDVTFAVGDGYLRRADAIVSGVDSVHARFVVNGRTRRVGRGWFDAAISADAIQVTAFGPTGPCYRCGLGDETVERMTRRFSCTGLVRSVPQGIVPTTAITSSVAGALVTHMLVGSLHGDRTLTGRRWTLHLGAERLVTDELPERRGCEFHPRRIPAEPESVGLDASASLAAVAEALHLDARAELELDHDVATSLDCPTCGRGEAMFQPVGEIDVATAACSSCGVTRRPSVTRRIALNGAAEGVPLSQLGLGPGSWLRVREKARILRFALAMEPAWV